MITAQCVLFYIAGYDTTATTLSFVSYCLALHPKIQQTLLEEVDRVLLEHDDEITFEAIQSMTYLDMVFAGREDPEFIVMNTNLNRNPPPKIRATN